MPWYCSICTEHFNDKKVISTAPCGHVFHLECLMRWIRESETCPECRQSVSSSRLVKLHLNNENDFDFKAVLHEKMEEIRKLGSQCRNAESKASAYFQEKCQLELEIKNADLQKNQFIKSLESKIENLLEINRYLNFENEHLNAVKTIVNGTQLEAEVVLSSYSSNVDKEDVVKKLASFCTILKCHLIQVTNEKKALEFSVQQLESECWYRTDECDKFMDQKLAADENARQLERECNRKALELDRFIGEKKALEFNVQQLESECWHRTREVDHFMDTTLAAGCNAEELRRQCGRKALELDRVIGEKKALESDVTQLQKLVEKLKKDISLLETAKIDSSGYTYSKDTPSCDDGQEMPSMSELPKMPTFSNSKLRAPVTKRKRNK